MKDCSPQTYIPFVVSLSKIPFVVSLSKIPFVVSLSNHAFCTMFQSKRLADSTKSVVRQAHHERLLKLTTNGCSDSPRTVLYGFDSLNNVPWDIPSSRSRKPPSPTPTSRYRVPSDCSTLAHNDNAMSVSAARESGGVSGV